MEYIHVKNLEKYHPGYKDRTLIWAKIYINMAEGDPDTEMILNEIDWGRLIRIILLELRAKKPLPNDNAYWIRKGFDVKKRPMSMTLNMLHNFIDTVTNPDESVTEPLRRVDKIREYKEDKKREIFVIPTLKEVTEYRKERGSSIDPQCFIDYYSSNGWQVGRNPMKDWRAAWRNWEKSNFNKNKLVIGNPVGIKMPPYKHFEQAPGEMDEVAKLIHKTAEELRNK